MIKRPMFFLVQMCPLDTSSQHFATPTGRASGEPQKALWDTQRWPLLAWMTCSKDASRQGCSNAPSHSKPEMVKDNDGKVLVKHSELGEIMVS